MTTIFTSSLVLLFGCQNQAALEQNDRDSTLAQQDSLDYKMVEFKDFSPYFSGTEEQIDTTLFTASYPKFQDHAINTLIQPAVFIDGEEVIEQVSESFISGFNELAEESLAQNQAQPFAWFRHQKCKVEFNKAQVLTLSHEIADYTGGAHGMYVKIWYNYDLTDKQPISLTEILQDSSQFMHTAEQLFRKQEGLSDTASFNSTYFFAEQQFTLSANFGLLKDGILLYYNPYEIKAYSEGITEVFIPYDAIKDLLNPKGKSLITRIQSINNPNS